MPSTALAIVATVASVAAAGVSAYGQYQAGQQQNAIYQFNAQQQENQARMQALSMQTQAALQRQQSEANFKLRTAEASAKRQNAKSLENQALQQDAVNRINLQKLSEDRARMRGTQRQTVAESGVVESTGTPLDVLVETVSKIQQERDEAAWIGELRRRTIFAEAARERLGGELAFAGATLDRDSGIASAALREAASRGELASGMFEAEISRLTGSAAATAGTYQAGATLLSGLSQAGSMYGDLFPRKKTSSGNTYSTV